MTLAELRAQLVKIGEEMGNIAKAAEAQARLMTQEESTKFDRLKIEFTSMEAEAARRQDVEDINTRLAQPQSRKASPATIEAATAGSRPNQANGGFKNWQDFLAALQRGPGVEPRLAAVTTYQNETSFGDGGVLVPTDFRSEILKAWMADEGLVSKFTIRPTSSLTVSFPSDEDAPHYGTGIKADNLAEGTSQSDSKTALGELKLSLSKKRVSVRVTDELLRDAPLMASYVPEKMGVKLQAQISREIVNGTGVGGQFLGLLNASSKVLVTRAAAGNNFDAADVGKMVARLKPGAFGKAFWVIHSSILPDIFLMVVGQQPVFQRDFSVSPYGTLFGRPIWVSEYAKAAGTAGDVILVNPDGYIIVAESGPQPQVMTSIHAAWDQDMTSFKALVRMDGKPQLSAPIARESGTDTLSDIVVLS